MTTHILDATRSCPAEGLKIALDRVSGISHTKIAKSMTKVDGRTDSPILPESEFKQGTYEVIFFAEDYLRDQCGIVDDPLFLAQIPIRFGISGDKHYHVILLLSTYAYSTYRGS